MPNPMISTTPMQAPGHRNKQPLSSRMRIQKPYGLSMELFQTFSYVISSVDDLTCSHQNPTAIYNEIPTCWCSQTPLLWPPSSYQGDIQRSPCPVGWGLPRENTWPIKGWGCSQWDWLTVCWILRLSKYFLSFNSIALAPLFPGLWRFKQGQNFKQWTRNNSKAFMKVLICLASPPQYTHPSRSSWTRSRVIFHQISSKPSMHFLTSVISHTRMSSRKTLSMPSMPPLNDSTTTMKYFG